MATKINLNKNWVQNGLNEVINVNAVEVEKTKDGALKCLITKKALEKALSQV